MVEELALEQQDVNQCCRDLQVSKSGYYAWLKRPPSIRQIEDERIWQKIKKYWETSRKTYGRRRLQKMLASDGENIGTNRVEKIMKENEIQGIGKKKFKPITTTSNHDLPIAERIFETENAPEQVTRPNQFWGGDLTYISTQEGWLYLSIFMDLFTRKIVGHAMRTTMHTEIITSSIEMALQRQGLSDFSQLTAHTDRGSQYASDDYRKKLAAFKITASMSRKGNCYDNAFVESFFRTLKVELIYTRTFKTREEARSAIFEFIEVWYNRQRIHSSLDYMTPEDYELKQTSAA